VAAAISLAPVPGGYTAVPAAIGLLRRNTRLALVSMQSSAIAPPFAGFQRTIATLSSTSDARRYYEKYVATGKPHRVLRCVLFYRGRTRSARPPQGSLLLAIGGKDQLIRKVSIALMHRNYRRHQPDAIAKDPL